MSNCYYCSKEECGHECPVFQTRADKLAWEMETLAQDEEFTAENGWFNISFQLNNGQPNANGVSFAPGVMEKAIMETMTKIDAIDKKWPLVHENKTYKIGNFKIIESPLVPMDTFGLTNDEPFSYINGHYSSTLRYAKLSISKEFAYTLNLLGRGLDLEIDEKFDNSDLAEAACLPFESEWFNGK